MDFLWGFQPDVLKSNLKMATLRINIIKNKKNSQVQVKKREVAKLLQAGKLEKARIQTESIIREDFTMEAMEIVSLMCDLLLERTKYVASEKDCPPDLKETISTIIWSANRIEVTELLEIKKQLTRKYGTSTIQLIESNSEHAKVNLRVIEKLSVQPPSNKLINKYMKEIAEKNNLDWSPIELDDLIEGPAPEPSGISVEMSPLANLPNAYQRITTSASEPAIISCPEIPPVTNYSLPIPLSNATYGAPPPPSPSEYQPPVPPPQPYYHPNNHQYYQPPYQYPPNPQYPAPPPSYLPPYNHTPYNYQQQQQQPQPPNLYCNDPMHYPPPITATPAFPYLEPEQDGYINNKDGSMSYAGNAVTYAEASVVSPVLPYHPGDDMSSANNMNDPPPPYPCNPGDDAVAGQLPRLPSPPPSSGSDHNNNNNSNSSNSDEVKDDSSLDELTARFSKLRN